MSKQSAARNLGQREAIREVLHEMKPSIRAHKVSRREKKAVLASIRRYIECWAVYDACPAPSPYSYIEEYEPGQDARLGAIVIAESMRIINEKLAELGIHFDRRTSEKIRAK